MALQLPYGFTKFTIADDSGSGLASLSPDDDQPYTFPVQPDNQEVELFSSPFTGKISGIIRQNNRSWEINIKNITQDQYENEIEIYRGLQVTFTPHNDEPTITYDMIMSYCEHQYRENNYYKDTVIIKLISQEYR